MYDTDSLRSIKKELKIIYFFKIFFLIVTKSQLVTRNDWTYRFALLGLSWVSSSFLGASQRSFPDEVLGNRSVSCSFLPTYDLQSQLN